MFQRNGRAGYVLKPTALRSTEKGILEKRTNHYLKVNVSSIYYFLSVADSFVQVISAQQLPLPKDSEGHEIIEKRIISPYVEVSIHIPDWTHTPFLPTSAAAAAYSPPTTPNSSRASIVATSARTITLSTPTVKDNGFNPVWEDKIVLPFDCVADMKDLIFVRFAVKHEGQDVESEPLAMYMASLGTLQEGTCTSPSALIASMLILACHSRLSSSAIARCPIVTIFILHAFRQHIYRGCRLKWSSVYTVLHRSAPVRTCIEYLLCICFVHHRIAVFVCTLHTEINT